MFDIMNVIQFTFWFGVFYLFEMVDDDDAIVAVVGKDIHGGTEGKGGQNTREKIGNFEKQNKKTLVEKKFFGFHAGSRH